MRLMSRHSAERRERPLRRFKPRLQAQGGVRLASILCLHDHFSVRQILKLGKAMGKGVAFAC